MLDYGFSPLVFYGYSFKTNVQQGIVTMTVLEGGGVQFFKFNCTTMCHPIDSKDTPDKIGFYKLYSCIFPFAADMNSLFLLMNYLLLI